MCESRRKSKWVSDQGIEWTLAGRGPPTMSQPRGPPNPQQTAVETDPGTMDQEQGTRNRQETQGAAKGKNKGNKGNNTNQTGTGQERHQGTEQTKDP